MIPRYSRPAIAAIWTDQRRLEIWWEVERTACEAMATLGEIPAEVAESLRQATPPSPERVAEIERITRHDVAAFVQAMEERVGSDAGKYIHLGLTSSDILDTTLAIQLRDAADILLADLHALADAIQDRALEHKWTPIIGRSHGIHAEPTTFGLVLAIWYAEVLRHITRLEEAKRIISVGKLSGAVGNCANVSPEVEAFVCDRLGLTPEPVSNQIVQRDRHAQLFTTLALIASSAEKFAIQIRHWQRTEVLEAEEPFKPGQKGSSAMPHKRNPILTENVTGLCRVVRSYALAAMENVALWHERDISHSSVERMIGPDATVTLDFLLHRLTGVIRELVVYPDNMRRNLTRTRGVVFSGRVLVALIREAGLGREEAYRLVQKSAQEAFDSGEDFEARVWADPEIIDRLGSDTVKVCFDLKAATGRVDEIFDRVFN